MIEDGKGQAQKAVNESQAGFATRRSRRSARGDWRTTKEELCAIGWFERGVCRVGYLSDRVGAAIVGHLLLPVRQTLVSPGSRSAAWGESPFAALPERHIQNETWS